MVREKLYAIAISAMRPDPEHTVTRLDDNEVLTEYQSNVGTTSYRTEFSCAAAVERAVSEEIAKEAAMIQGKQIFPKADRWTMHAVDVVEIDSSVILEAVASIETALRPSFDEPEREM
jgi:hypothetical protein